MKDTNSLGYKIGYGIGIVIMCCVAAIIIAFTIKTVAWLIF